MNRRSFFGRMMVGVAALAGLAKFQPSVVAAKAVEVPALLPKCAWTATSTSAEVSNLPVLWEIMNRGVMTINDARMSISKG